MNFQTFTHTVTAGGNGVARRFVSFSGNLAQAADAVLGVSRSAFKLGEAFAVDVLGVTAVESGGAVAAGDKITPDAQGRAVKAPEGATNIAGYATTGAIGPGRDVLVLLK